MTIAQRGATRFSRCAHRAPKERKVQGIDSYKNGAPSEHG